MWLPSGSVSSSAGIPTPRTDPAHRYPRPHHFVLKYRGLARAHPATLPLPTAWYRRNRKRDHEPPNPGRPPFHGGTESLEPRPGYTLTRTGGWPGVCTMWTRCMRLKMRMLLSRRTILPQTPTTPKEQKNRSNITPPPGVVSLIPQTAPVGAGLVPALAPLPQLNSTTITPGPPCRPRAHLAAQGRASKSRSKDNRLPSHYSSENSSSSSSSTSGSQPTKNVSGSSPKAIKKVIASTKVAFSRSRNGSSGAM